MFIYVLLEAIVGIIAGIMIAVRTKKPMGSHMVSLTRQDALPMFFWQLFIRFSHRSIFFSV